jgi:uncharacterized membrane protein required for colicin V production
MTLSLYDGVMLGIIVVCVIQGAMKGMAWQLAPIASLVLGYLLGVPLSAATAQWFGGWFPWGCISSPAHCGNQSKN